MIITDKQTQDNYNKQKAEDFIKEFKELCKKHGLMHHAMLRPTDDALYAVLGIVEFKEKI